MTAIKLIIFDMDGIIFDSEKLYMHFLKLIMKDIITT